jgi:hypothetical protein
MTIDTTNMCSHLQRKLFEEDGIYYLVSKSIIYTLYNLAGITYRDSV